MAEVFGYDIRATHKNGRRVTVSTITNERTQMRAMAALARVKEANPKWRFIVVERRTNGSERVIGTTR